ncbi:unnamed protein product, partial [Iphiclides podalirius]
MLRMLRIMRLMDSPIHATAHCPFTASDYLVGAPRATSTFAIYLIQDNEPLQIMSRRTHNVTEEAAGTFLTYA